MLLTESDPVEWVTVMLGPAGITTSSNGPGTAPVLQLAAVLQSSLWPIHVTVPALIGWKAEMMKNAQRDHTEMATRRFPNKFVMIPRVLTRADFLWIRPLMEFFIDLQWRDRSAMD
jgi:hypothetical protein